MLTSTPAILHEGSFNPLPEIEHHYRVLAFVQEFQNCEPIIHIVTMSRDRIKHTTIDLLRGNDTRSYDASDSAMVTQLHTSWLDELATK